MKLNPPVGPKLFSAARNVLVFGAFTDPEFELEMKFAGPLNGLTFLWNVDLLSSVLACVRLKPLPVRVRPVEPKTLAKRFVPCTPPMFPSDPKPPPPNKPPPNPPPPKPPAPPN